MYFKIENFKLSNQEYQKTLDTAISQDFVSLIEFFQFVDIMKCLINCAENNKCLFALIEENKCKLFNQQAKDYFTKKTGSILYKK